MRAGRLLNLVLILQQRGRATATELAERLEVTERTVMRDIEALSGAGVPVYATRGPGGGFQLLEGYDPGPISPSEWRPRERRPGRPRRATVRISIEGRRLAALLGRLQPLRVKRDVPADKDGWLQATFRLESIEGVAIDVLSLGPQIEILAPPELRDAVADRARRTAQLYRKERYPPRMTLVLDYVELAVDDIEQSKTFYEQALGWTFTDYGPAYAGMQDPRNPGQEFGGLNAHPVTSRGDGVLVLARTDDADAALAAVLAAGGRVVDDLAEYPGGRRFTFADPSGNILGVYEPAGQG